MSNFINKIISSLLLLVGTYSSHSQVVSSIEEMLAQKEYAKTIKYCDSLVTIDDFKPLYFNIYKLQADAYYEINDIEKTLQSYLFALKTPEIDLPKNITLLQEILSYVGYCYNELGLDEEAIAYYNKSLAIAINLSDSVEIAIGHYNISNSQLKLGQLENAMQNLSVAYTIDVSRKDTSAIGFDLNAMGYAQLITGNAQKAINYYKESIDLLHQSSGNQSSLGTRYNNLGKAYMSLQKWDSANVYIKKSIVEHEKNADSLNLVERWISMADLFNKKSNYNEALIWSNKAKSYFDKRPPSNQTVSVNFALIDSYIGLKQYALAMQLSNQNISLANEFGLLPQLIRATQLKADLYERNNQLKEALLQIKKVATLNDSLIKMESQHKLSELEVKYQLDNVLHNNEILTLQKEMATSSMQRKSTQLKWLIASLVLVIIFSFALVRALVSRSKIKHQLLQTEIDQLRIQIMVTLKGDTTDFKLDAEQLNKSLDTTLSEREFEILKHVFSDLSNSQIAEKTFVSVNTVKYHLKNIYEKLGVANRKEALKFAIEATK